jgi:hypothetical protein
MTDKHIQKLIDMFSQTCADYLIISQSISAHVRYALVWDEKNFHQLIDISPYHFYFLMNEDDQAIGAVLDMNKDLHWYVAPGFRKLGFLTRALKDSILPHLAQKRRTQYITINKNDIGEENFIASLSVAKNCGFRLYGGIQQKTQLKQGLIKYKKILAQPFLEGMDLEEMTELRKYMNEAIGKVSHIQSKMEMKLGSSKYTYELKRTIKLLTSYRNTIMEDSLFDFDELKKN